MTKWTVRGIVLCGALLAGASLQAHHSLAGMYALGKEAKVTGAFKAFRLINPHSSLKLDVKGKDGEVVEWSILGGSVQQFARLGVGRTGPNSLKPGDEIVVTHMPALDGKSPIGLLIAITYFRGADE
jgi:hypothetical protein